MISLGLFVVMSSLCGGRIARRALWIVAVIATFACVSFGKSHLCEKRLTTCKNDLSLRPPSLFLHHHLRMADGNRLGASFVVCMLRVSSGKDKGHLLAFDECF